MQTIFGSESVTDFITAWPILCIPEGIFLYTIAKYFDFKSSRIRMLLCLSVPGLILTILWANLFSQRVDEFFSASLVFIPTNILTPFDFIYSIVSFFFVLDGNSRARSNFTMFLITLLLVAYCYDQIIVFVDPGGS